MSALIHVVPHLPPRVNGVGDFAVLLGAAVERHSDGSLPSRYIAAGWDAADASPPSVNLTGQRSSLALFAAITAERPAAVLLHSVGYGYERRGCPVWLVEALRLLRHRQPEIRVLSWFHELYALGVPWRSSFWLSPLQRKVTADLARLSDAAFTNRHASAAWLRRHAPQTPVDVCPTPSNVGEPATVRPWKEREPVAVVFGGASQRKAVYARPDMAVRRVLDRAGVDRICDIGPPTETPDAYAGRPVVRLGKLDAADVSERLQSSRVGLAHYPPAFLSKSGIAAAYLAHGVPLLTVSADRRAAGENPPPMLAPMADALLEGWEDIAALTNQGHVWYTAHAHSAAAAARLLRLLDVSPTLVQQERARSLPAQ